MHITAVHVSQPGFDGEVLALEFEAMLGRNWAEAIKDDFNVVQVAPGLMELDPTHDANAIRLAWYYLTEFRYRMTKGPRKEPPRIEKLLADAKIPVDRRKLTRTLDRLDGWHRRLHELQIIGRYERTPPAAEACPWQPSRVYAEGFYGVEPPTTILAAYREQREKSLAEARRKRAGRRTAGVRG